MGAGAKPSGAAAAPILSFAAMKLDYLNGRSLRRTALVLGALGIAAYAADLRDLATVLGIGFFVFAAVAIYEERLHRIEARLKPLEDRVR